MSHFSSRASSPSSPAHSSIRRKDFPAWLSWLGIPNPSNIQMHPHKPQSDTLLPPPVPNRSSDMLSAPLSAIIHQRAARHRVRQNCRTEHHVHAGKQPVGNKNMSFHPLLYDFYCCHRVIYYCTYRFFQYFALLLQYLTVMENLNSTHCSSPPTKSLTTSIHASSPQYTCMY